MGFRNNKEIIDAWDAGQTHFTTFRKVPTQTTGSNQWFDLSMSTGNPVPNYYIGVPNQFTRMARSTDNGINHGSNVAPATKYLKTWSFMTQTATAVPLPTILYDMVGFYPFVDESNTDWQTLDNSVTPNRWLEDTGVTFGAELAVNSDCTSGTTGYTGQGATLTNPTGSAVLVTANASGANFGISQTISGLTIGKEYVVTWRHNGASTTGSLYSLMGRTGVGAINYRGYINEYPQVGSFVDMSGVTRTLTFTAEGTSFYLYIYANTASTIGDVFNLELFSVKEIIRTKAKTENSGLQIMPVVVAGQIGNINFSVNYTNQDGIAWRITEAHYVTTQSVNGTILTSTGNGGAFLKLYNNDTGVRSIESIKFLSSDIGLAAFALVKPLATHQIYDITAPSEKEFTTTPVIIPDDAYLNMVCLPSGSISGAQINGTMEFIWN